MNQNALMLAALIALAGCDEEPETANEPPETEDLADELSETAEDPGGPQSDTPLPEYMQEHFTEATEIRDALVRGDLGAAKGAAQRMAARAPTASFPPNWSPYVTNIRSAASRVDEAPELDQAGLRAGDIAHVCADCHTNVGANVELEAVPPPEGDDAATHMLRHQWALDRMWEGLMAPADDRWTAGAGALVEAPLHPHAIAENQTGPDDLRALAERVHSLGTNASQTTDPQERAQLYGELLSTCHTCHSQVEGAPGSGAAGQR